MLDKFDSIKDKLIKSLSEAQLILVMDMDLTSIL